MEKYVSSSNLQSVGYDPDSLMLEIEFHDSRIYQYFNVPRQIHNGLMSASSKGIYYDAYIKKGPFRFRKVR